VKELTRERENFGIKARMANLNFLISEVEKDSATGLKNGNINYNAGIA